MTIFLLFVGGVFLYTIIGSVIATLACIYLKESDYLEKGIIACFWPFCVITFILCRVFRVTEQLTLSILKRVKTS